MMSSVDISNLVEKNLLEEKEVAKMECLNLLIPFLPRHLRPSILQDLNVISGRAGSSLFSVVTMRVGVFLPHPLFSVASLCHQHPLLIGDEVLGLLWKNEVGYLS